MSGITRRVAVAGGLLALGALGVDTYRQLNGAGYRAAQARLRAPLPAQADTNALIRFATLAANGHNTQPWVFEPQAGQMALHPDLTRRTPVVDPDDHHLFASLGCAAENLGIAARARGMAGEVAFAGATDGLIVDLAPGTPESDDLLRAIPLRQSTRGMFDGSTLSDEEIARLTQAATDRGVEAIYISEPSQKQAVLDLVVDGNSRQMDDPAFVAELLSWLRFNPRDAVRRGDGLYGGSTGSPPLPGWLGPGLFKQVFKKDSENAKYAAQVTSSAGLIVLVAGTDTPEGWVAAGRACQRLMLQATADGLKCAFLNQAVEVPAMRKELQALLGIGDARPNLVLRVGRGAALPQSLRRPVAQVLAG